MKIVCLVKIVPDVESFSFDRERNTLSRDSLHQLINPEDATALAIALDLKRKVPGTAVETLSMGPPSVLPFLEDVVRRGVDEATLLSDTRFAGSDTYATSHILARQLVRMDYDCVFSGTRTLDGGTAHVPAQIAELLDLAHLSDISSVDPTSFSEEAALVEVEDDEASWSVQIDFPAILGFLYSPKRKLPYIPHEALNLDVSGRIRRVDNRELDFGRDEVGAAGSLTSVASVQLKVLAEKESRIVGTDPAGIEEVYAFLSKHGYLRA